MNNEQLFTIWRAANEEGFEVWKSEFSDMLSASIADTAGAKQTYPVGEVELQEGGYVGVRWLKPAPDEGTPLYAATPASSVADAAGASEGQAEPIYQVRPRNGEEWTDVSEAEYHISGGSGYLQRIVYLHPSAEIAVLRERIAGMEKDAGRGSVAALQSARHAVYTASTLDEAFTSVQKLIDAAITKEQK
jgi:hypothetical protein